MPNLFAQLNVTDPMINFHTALVSMYDLMLQSGKITDPTTVEKIARLRAQSDIALKGL